MARSATAAGPLGARRGTDDARAAMPILRGIEKESEKMEYGEKKGRNRGKVQRR